MQGTSFSAPRRTWKSSDGSDFPGQIDGFLSAKRTASIAFAFEKAKAREQGSASASAKPVAKPVDKALGGAKQRKVKGRQRWPATKVSV